MYSDSIKNESVILEVFAGLDVILILICPVQLYFFAFIRDSVHAFLVAALGNEVAVLIVPVKEGVQCGIYVGLQCRKVCALRQLLL